MSSCGLCRHLHPHHTPTHIHTNKYKSVKYAIRKEERRTQNCVSSKFLAV